jgi:hypothetical protein
MIIPFNWNDIGKWNLALGSTVATSDTTRFSILSNRHAHYLVAGLTLYGLFL